MEIFFSKVLLERKSYLDTLNCPFNGHFEFIQLVEEWIVKLDKICRNANVILVVARSYGLTGLVRISLKVKYY